MKTLCTKINSNGMVVVSAPLVMSLVFWVKQSCVYRDVTFFAIVNTEIIE